MNKKNRIRAGIIFGIAMAAFYIIQDLLSNDKQAPNYILKAVVPGLIAGVLAGVLFGWLIGRFVKSRFVSETTKIQTGIDEDVLFETPANHFKGIEAVGGKLYLTNTRLIFKSHKLNVQNHELSINLTNIQNVTRYKSLGFIKNGLSVTTMDNKTEKFVVEQGEEWLKHLKKEELLMV
jgi:hypothetical protein